MTPLQQLQANLANLDRTIASGVRTAILDGQQVTYNTTTSLMEARNNVVQQINAIGLAGRVRPRQTYLFQSGRGYDHGDR